MSKARFKKSMQRSANRPTVDRCQLRATRPEYVLPTDEQLVNFVLAVASGGVLVFPMHRQIVELTLKLEPEVKDRWLAKHRELNDRRSRLQ